MSISTQPNTKENILEIDGSILEGGGQILRISISLSIIVDIPIIIYNIRKGRPNPGLQNQHLNTCLSIKELFKGYSIEGTSLNSTKISLFKQKEEEVLSKEDYMIDLNGAGSIGLAIQQLLPCILLMSKKEMIKINLKGGTIVSFSPSTYYLKDCLFQILNKIMNVEVIIDLKKHGLYPEGRGDVNLFIKNIYNSIENKESKGFSGINITEKKNLYKVLIRTIRTSNLVEYKEGKGHKIEKNLRKTIVKSLIENGYSVNPDSEEDFNENDENNDNLVYIDIQYEDEIVNISSKSKSYVYVIEAIFYYENTIIYHEEKYCGKKDINNETMILMSEKLVEDITRTIENKYKCLDEYTVDHLLVFMCLSSEESIIHIDNLSLHSETAIFIIKKFIPDLEIEVSSLEDKSNGNIGKKIKIKKIIINIT